jgi:hypothetical protein
MMRNLLLLAHWEGSGYLLNGVIRAARQLQRRSSTATLSAPAFAFNAYWVARIGVMQMSALLDDSVITMSGFQACSLRYLSTNCRFAHSALSLHLHR